MLSFADNDGEGNEPEEIQAIKEIIKEEMQ